MTISPSPPSAYGRPLLQLAREIGKHLATMHRWRTRGVLDSSGIRRTLPMIRVGGRWYVRDSDLSEFFAALAADGKARASPKGQADRSRTALELDAAGIK
jgi:hypothetical protein